METSLHRQLKALYAPRGATIEAPLGRYRIDVISAGALIEIQHGSLAAIRGKVRDLVRRHQVLVVKPIVRRKHLVKQDAKGGRVISRRLSPRRGGVLDLFAELVYFTQLFPNPNLTIDAPLVDVEEWRYPGHGRRRRWSATDYVVEDQRLLSVDQGLRLRRPGDLWQLIPEELPHPFHTEHLAEALKTPRHVAQRVAYCLRQTGAVTSVGKQGNTWLYERRAAV